MKKDTFGGNECTHQGNNLGVSAVKDERQEGVEEHAHKLDHLQSRQVPVCAKGALFHVSQNIVINWDPQVVK